MRFGAFRHAFLIVLPLLLDGVWRIFELTILMIALGRAPSRRAASPFLSQPLAQGAMAEAARPGRWSRPRAPRWRRARAEAEEVQAPVLEGRGVGGAVRLRHGLRMPQLGLGSGDLEGARGREAIRRALESGYRLIDTALFYRTQRGAKEVGGIGGILAL